MKHLSRSTSSFVGLWRPCLPVPLCVVIEFNLVVCVVADRKGVILKGETSVGTTTLQNTHSSACQNVHYPCIGGKAFLIRGCSNVGRVNWMPESHRNVASRSLFIYRRRWLRHGLPQLSQCLPLCSRLCTLAGVTSSAQKHLYVAVVVGSSTNERDIMIESFLACAVPQNRSSQFAHFLFCFLRRLLM